MDSGRVRELQIIAARVRKNAVTGVYHAKSGHPGGSLSVADVLTYLYFEAMRVDPKNPHDPNRDRFVLSKGHCAPGLYGVLAEKGFFSRVRLDRGSAQRTVWRLQRRLIKKITVFIR